jgi:hypothetical protein
VIKGNEDSSVVQHAYAAIKLQNPGLYSWAQLEAETAVYRFAMCRPTDGKQRLLIMLQEEFN